MKFLLLSGPLRKLAREREIVSPREWFLQEFPELADDQMQICTDIANCVALSVGLHVTQLRADDEIWGTYVPTGIFRGLLNIENNWEHITTSLAKFIASSRGHEIVKDEEELPLHWNNLRDLVRCALDLVARAK